MTIERAGLYTIDGRLRGSYVYMVLWRIDVRIQVKLGRSSSPFAGLKRWTEAHVICIAEVPTLHTAVRLEAQLREVFIPWRADPECFSVRVVEWPTFKAAWRPVLDAMSSPSRRIHWRNYSVQAIATDAIRRRRERQRTFMQRPLTYQDYRQG
jgi:hypothetical protein